MFSALQTIQTFATTVSPYLILLTGPLTSKETSFEPIEVSQFCHRLTDTNKIPMASHQCYNKMTSKETLWESALLNLPLWCKSIDKQRVHEWRSCVLIKFYLQKLAVARFVLWMGYVYPCSRRLPFIQEEDKKPILALAGVAQWLSAGLWIKGLLVWFLVRAYAWVSGQVPSRGCTRSNHTLMFLSLSFSLLSPL